MLCFPLVSIALCLKVGKRAKCGALMRFVLWCSLQAFEVAFEEALDAAASEITGALFVVASCPTADVLCNVRMGPEISGQA